MPDPSQPTAILTGASGGIGRAAALLLARNNFNLALVGRTASTLKQLADDVGRVRCPPSQPQRDPTSTSPPLVIAADQSIADDCQRIITETLQSFSRIDVLINNAATCEISPLLQSSDDHIRHTFATNFLGPLHLIQLAIPHMLKQRGGQPGRIINISSMAAFDPFPGLAIYAASKCALDSITRSITNECGGTAGSGGGSECYSIAPGAVETPMLRSVVSAAELPPDRALDPAVIAQTILECAQGRRPADAGKVIQIPSP